MGQVWMKMTKDSAAWVELDYKLFLCSLTEMIIHT